MDIRRRILRQFQISDLRLRIGAWGFPGPLPQSRTIMLFESAQASLAWAVLLLTIGGEYPFLELDADVSYHPLTNFLVTNKVIPLELRRPQQETRFAAGTELAS